MSGVFVFILRILISIALYLFLGFVLFSIWKEVRFQTSQEKRNKTPNLKLLATNPGSQPIDIKEPQNTLGRSKTCQVVVNHKSISARHATISYHDNQWWVEDLRSKNGTYINDLQVTTPTVFTSDDRLRCGEVEWIVHLELRTRRR